MGRPRACDVCSLRKIRCSGAKPCGQCAKAGFECSYTKKLLTPGPKGPRPATCNRIKKQVQDFRAQDVLPLPSRPSLATPKHSSPDRMPPSYDMNKSPNAEVVPSPSSYGSYIQPVPGPSSITYADVCTYLDIYHHKLYPVWPVVDRLLLLKRLGPEMKDPEICALAFAICAATEAQLRLDEDSSEGYVATRGLNHAHQPVKHRFGAEAERHRSMYDYRERLSVPGILVPFFLHLYHFKKKRQSTSSLLLRESLTMCQMLELDKETSYLNLDPDEQQYRRKIFWVLFVTERGRKCLSKHASA